MRVEVEKRSSQQISQNSTIYVSNFLQQLIETNWRLRIFLIFMILAANMNFAYSAGLRLQACDEDFRQMSNWLCARPGEKTPCYKFYFDVPEWKDNYTQKALDEFGQTCCEETGCAIVELKKHCCLEERCFEFCYTK